MSLCFPSTPRKVGTTVGCFFAGAALFGIGLHFAYVNVGPQQARIKARGDFVKEKLRKKYGKKLLFYPLVWRQTGGAYGSAPSVGSSYKSIKDRASV